DFALLALYRLGGAEQMVDLEHVAVEAHRLAPQLFKWRFYDYPSVEICRMALRHGNERSGEPLVAAGDAGRKRRLTAAGVRRVLQFEAGLPPPAGGAVRPVARELLQMEKHPALARWRQGGTELLSVYDLADLLSFQPNSPRALIEERLRSAAASAER